MYERTPYEDSASYGSVVVLVGTLDPRVPMPTESEVSFNAYVLPARTNSIIIVVKTTNVFFMMAPFFLLLE